MTSYQVVDLVLRILGFLVALLMAYLAINAEHLRHHLARKRLKIRLGLPIIAAHNSGHQEAYWHIIVENSRLNYPCRNVRVVLEKIYKRNGSAWELVPSTWQPNFFWENEGRLMDLGEKTDPDAPAKRLFGNLEGPTIGQSRNISLARMEQGKCNTLILTVKNPSVHVSKKFGEASSKEIEITYENYAIVVLRAFSDEVYSNDLWIQLRPNGKWSPEPTELAQFFEIPSKLKSRLLFMSEFES